MPARIYISKKELEDLIQVGKAVGTDTSQLEALLAEVASEKSAGSKARPVSGRELELARKESSEYNISPD